VGGALALAAAAVALVWANLAGGSYDDLRHLRVGPLDLEHWSADGALTLFFFVAGLELKRELLVGSLRKPADALVPVVAAACGVAVPALVFLVVQLGAGGAGDPAGWAVPTATDIAFALAVLAVVGPALPVQLALAGYAVLQRARARVALLQLPVALGAWWAVHESGIHATVAGVALGLLTRVLPDPGEADSPGGRLEHLLTPVSAGVAVPLFAFTSAGVGIAGGGALLADPVVLGVLLGLVLGKPAGVLGGAWLAARLGRSTLDPAVSWRDLAGVAVLCGMGFTVSLLVSDLAFTGVRRDEAKAAVLLASMVSALIAAVVLRRRNRRHRRIAEAG
jgi:NhaA family Na+:H+ antiporter